MELLRDKWSEELKKIKPEVKNIYYKGNIDLLLDSAPKLAIVGSRRMTDYGLRVVEKWMPELVRKGITIVSGFMYGVDQTAHKACIENGGKTIAVLGWGIDRRPAGDDEKLYRKILEVDSPPAGRASLIVSEYPGEMGAEKWTFPQRNRIVAGVSDAVLVIEAAENSGSLITANWARRYSKRLLAIPGQVTSKVAEGTNGLIREGRARMVTSVEETLFAMGLKPGQMSFRNEFPSNPILETLDIGEKSLDELARILCEPVEKVSNELFALELDGLVREKGGKYFVV